MLPINNEGSSQDFVKTLKAEKLGWNFHQYFISGTTEECFSRQGFKQICTLVNSDITFALIQEYFIKLFLIKREKIIKASLNNPP